MQPTYLPWLGYFALMAAVDTFVFFDSVQFARRSWQQRNQIKTAAGPAFLTVPVKKTGRRDQLILETEINGDEKPLEKHIRTIQSELKKAPYFNTYSDDLFEIMSRPKILLAELNIELISYLKNCLSIDTPSVHSSTLGASGTKADLLADICDRLHADHYLSPPGSKEYMDASDAFTKRRIDVTYFDYLHPQYGQQHGEFVPYMSVIDLLFNEGPASRDFLLSGIKNSENFT